MKRPICKVTSYNSFRLTKDLCTRSKASSLFLDLELKDWSNIEAVISADNNSNDGEKSLKRYMSSLKNLSENLTRHPYVKIFANEVRSYLDTPSVKQEYYNKFQKKKDNEALQSVKQQVEKQTEIILENGLLLKGKKRLREAVDEIRNFDNETGVSISESVSLPATSESVSLPASSKSVFSPSASSKKKLSNVSEIIYIAAVSLHTRYQQNIPLTASELKTMACGLSSIVDLDSEEVSGSQRMLFSDEVWNKLKNKYTKKYKLILPPLPFEIKQQWKLVSSLCQTNNDSSSARRFINKLKTKPDISVKHERCLDLLSEIIYLIDSKRFMLDDSNSKKISERDYAYQLWVPLLSKLFFINNNMVRIKVGETVLAGTTFEKSLLYHGISNIVGFKVDIRVLVDFKDEEFDLMCGEACTPNANYTKCSSDKSKLAREGKEIRGNLAQVHYNDDYDIYAWMVQVQGLNCSFSTIHSTPYHYHVNVHQFDIAFPISYACLNDNNSLFLEYLFLFKDSIEKLAMNLNRKLQSSSIRMSPERDTHVPLAPTWFTPPREDCSLSRLPVHMRSETEESSEEENDGDYDQENNENHDKYGFIEREDGWYNVYTKEYWKDDLF